MPLPKVSLIIPVYNGAATLPAFFAALQTQTLIPDELLIGDSESSDGSLSICQKQDATIITIPKGTFDHGGTRSELAKMAKGDLLVFLTQDAIFAAKDSLEKLIQCCLESDEIGCAYGRQLAKSDATLSAITLREFNYPAESQLRSFNDRNKYGLKTAFISNSFAVYKKAVLAENGYFKDNLILGEDTCTAGRILLAGFKVAYCADATVYHSHNYTILEDFRRSFDIGVLHSRESWLLESYGGATKIGGNFVLLSLKKIFEKKKYLLIIDWFFRNGGKYTGYKLGRNADKIPGFLRPFFSMHRMWWKNS